MNITVTGISGVSNNINGGYFKENIFLKSARIKARAVDGVPSIMTASGPLSASDKQKIID